MKPAGIPLLGFCAWGSGIGKTTLLTSLIPILVTQGMRVSVIKHAHHSFDIDHPGKDSYRLRQAGAAQMMLGSAKRWALMTEHFQDQQNPQLEELLSYMDYSLADLILVEGFRHEPIPKIEVFRPTTRTPLLAAQDPHVIAIATDGEVETTLPVLDLNNPQAIARFVLEWLQDRN